MFACRIYIYSLFFCGASFLYFKLLGGSIAKWATVTSVFSVEQVFIACGCLAVLISERVYSVIWRLQLLKVKYLLGFCYKFWLIYKLYLMKRVLPFDMFSCGSFINWITIHVNFENCWCIFDPCIVNILVHKYFIWCSRDFSGILCKLIIFWKPPPFWI